MPVHRSPDLVGRDAELEELSSQLGIAASGTPGAPGAGAAAGEPELRAVLLAGDAGVGKTRLLSELRDRAVDAGWQVVAGHCLDLGDSALPYLPFSEVLGRLATDAADVVESTMADHPVLGRLQPGRRIRSSGEGGDEVLERADLFEAVHALLDRVGGAGPLLVILEDAHWADRSTRDLISFLLSRPVPGPVQLVVSYRSDDLHRRHPLRPQVAEWSRLRGVGRLQLEPLPAGAVRRLVRLLHPDPMSETSVGDIVSRAEGNAFFVEELVGATWATGGVPTDLADLLLVRLDRLDDAARRVVRATSVAGRQVSHHLLAAATGIDPDALEGALRSAVEMNVLVPVRRDSYAFRHALLGEAVYDDLLPGERVRLHAAYARVLRAGEAAGTAAELARHARLGQDPRTGLLASIEAGDDAMRVAGPEEAAQHYEQALALLSDPAVGDLPDLDVPHLVTRTAEALTSAGHVQRANATLRAQLDRMPEDAPAADRGQLMAALAWGLAIVDSPDDELEMARRAVELLAGGSPAQRARALAGLARILAGYLRLDEARDVAGEALALSRQHDMPRLGADILTTMVGLDKHGLEDAVGESLAEVVEQARASGAVNAELRAGYLLGRFHQDRAELDLSVAVHAATQRRGAELGLPWSPYAFEARFMRGIVLVMAGRWDEALDVVDVSGESPPPVYEAMLAGVEAQVLAGRGDASAAGLVDIGRPHWRKEGVIAITGTTALLELAEQAGDADAARAAYDDVVKTLSETWHDRFQARLRFAASTLGVLATAATRLPAGDREAVGWEARELYDDGRRVFDHHRELGVTFGPEAMAWVARLSAELLRFRWLAQVDPPAEDELVAAWRSTEQAFEAFGNVHELARVRARLAAVLRATGDAEGARLAGDAARAAAHALGARPLLDELVALGSSAAPRTGSPDGLTPREAEILALVAEGRTNGEIGKQLFISTKTVSVHVSRILAKLGAASRTEAAAVARREGLL